MTKNPPGLQKKLNIERNEEVKRLSERLRKVEGFKNNLQKQIDVLKAEVQCIKLGLKE